jgi:hypothetical protein
VVKVGVQLFRELGDRADKLEGELGVYREAMVTLANHLGVEVPLFLTSESGGLGQAGSAEQLRQWLQVVVSPTALTGRVEGSAKRGASGPRKRGREPRGKRGKDRMDEGQ